MAQDWPSKPVRFIVPFPPGGSVDPLARLLGAKLADALKQQFIVENRPGAGGSIGTAAVAKAPADGYTFVVVFDSHGVNQALISKPALRHREGFRAGDAGRHRALCDRHAGGQALEDRSRDVVGGLEGQAGFREHRLDRQRHARPPGAGAGAADRPASRSSHVPFAGGGPMNQNILGGQIDMGVGSVALLSPQVKGGKMRAIATTGRQARGMRCPTCRR